MNVFIIVTIKILILRKYKKHMIFKEKKFSNIGFENFFFLENHM